MNGKNYFYFVCPMGLEDVSLTEVEEKLVDFELIEKSPGGFEIMAQTQEVFAKISHFKSVTRILIRSGVLPTKDLFQTKVRDLPTLFQKVSKYNWSQFLNGDFPEVSVSAKTSRLFDSRKIIKTIHDGIRRHYEMKPVKKKYLDRINSIVPTTIYVRLIDDIMTVSFDLCGERLDRRKDKLLSAKAPIRETIAYSMIKMTLLELQKRNLSIPKNILDPFVGTGTILKEAFEFNDALLTREKIESFPYLYFPMFEKMEKKSYENSNQSPLFEKYTGIEIDQETYNAAKSNLQKIETLKLLNQDFFQNKTIFHDTLLITNPPYGLRVGENEVDEDFLSDTISHAHQIGIKILGIVSLIEQTKKIKKDVIFRKAFENGGLKVEFILLYKP